MEINQEVKKCLELETEAIIGKRGASENVIILLYELGRVAHCMIYSAPAGLDGRELSAYCAEMCMELGDVITQALMIFEKVKVHTKGFNDMSPSELIEAGLEKQQNRMKELIAKGGLSADLL